jgi:hypothetical protein
MFSFIKSLFIPKVELAEYNKGDSFRLAGVPFARLCDCIAQLPELVFTRKKTFIWSLERHEADFTFRGHAFAIETDNWDGAFWVISKTGKRPAEMQELREQIERCIISPRVSHDHAA